MFNSNHQASSDDDDDDVLSKQVLPMNDDFQGSIDLTQMPTTGEEYLRQVRFQASQLPDFQTANRRIDSTTSNSKTHAWHKLFSANKSSSSTTTTSNVSDDWQNEQCQLFSTVRNDYFQMRDRLRTKNSKYKTLKLRNANQYWKFCFEEQQPVQIDDFNLDQQEQIQNPLPTMTKMITLTQPQLHELLQHEIDWVKQHGCSIHLAMYTYATLVAIEKPISEDVMYTMRQTCLVWKQTRTKLLSESESDPSLIKSCDLFVCIIGRYFGQFDLADTKN